jgi:hypothetical protein
LKPSLQSTQDMLSLFFPLISYVDKGTIESFYLYISLLSNNPLELYQFILDSTVQPFFALSWVLTWFSHGFDNLDVIARLFDLFIATNPLMIIYLSTQVLL